MAATVAGVRNKPAGETAPAKPRSAATRPVLRGLWHALTPATVTRLAKLGIARPFDLVLHLPLRYDDETQLHAINAAPAGQPVLVEGAQIASRELWR